MKRFICFIAVFAIVFSLCFSVSAADYTIPDYPFVDGWDYVFYCDITVQPTGDIHRFTLYTDNISVFDKQYLYDNFKPRLYVSSWTNETNFTVQNNLGSGFIEHYIYNGGWNKLSSHLGNSQFLYTFEGVSSTSVVYGDFPIWNEDFTLQVYSTGYTPEPDEGETDQSEEDNILSGFFDTLWGWLGDIIDWFKNIFSALIDIPDRIAGFIRDTLKDIFVPDTEAISEIFHSFIDDMKMKFGFDTSVFNTLFDNETAVQDTSADYNISGVGNLKLKFLDTSFLKQGVAHFRPLIRGFLVLLMFFYNIKMILSFIRQDAGVITGKAVDMGKGDKK